MTEIAPRVIILGDSGVGKTTLIHRIKTGEFLEDTTPTIGAGVTAIDIEAKGQVYPFQIWDTAGQEMYRNIIPIYFKGAVFAIVVFALNDVKSFNNLDSWLDEIATHSDPRIGLVLVGNKCDTQDKEVSDESAKKYAADHSLTLFFTSSLTGQNVNAVMEYVATTYNNMKEITDVPKNVNLAESGNNPKDKKGCC